jgi:hypothetical protein
MAALIIMHGRIMDTRLSASRVMDLTTGTSILITILQRTGWRASISIAWPISLGPLLPGLCRFLVEAAWRWLTLDGKALRRTVLYLLHLNYTCPTYSSLKQHNYRFRIQHSDNSNSTPRSLSWLPFTSRNAIDNVNNEQWNIQAQPCVGFDYKGRVG